MKEFFKPTKRKIIIFIILIIISYIIFMFTNPRIFPCKTQPVIENPPPFESTICSFNRIGPFNDMWIGVNIKTEPLSYLLELIFLVLIPYLIACLIIKK
jgi:hypothetical protein